MKVAGLLLDDGLPCYVNTVQVSSSHRDYSKTSVPLLSEESSLYETRGPAGAIIEERRQQTDRTIERGTAS